MVLDASGAVEFLLNTETGKRLALRLADDRETVHVPHLIDLEIAQVMRRYVHSGTITERMGLRALQRWRDLDVERYPHEPFLGRVWNLRNNLTAYDAVYVALAETLSVVLVTGDRKLVGSPGVHAVIEII